MGRRVTKWVTKDSSRKDHHNFLSYTFDAARIMKDPGIKKQVKKHWKRLRDLLHENVFRNSRDDLLCIATDKNQTFHLLRSVATSSRVFTSQILAAMQIILNCFRHQVEAFRSHSHGGTVASAYSNADV